jgi:hypothetical protein
MLHSQPKWEGGLDNSIMTRLSVGCSDYHPGKPAVADHSINLDHIAINQDSEQVLSMLPPFIMIVISFNAVIKRVK